MEPRSAENLKQNRRDGTVPPVTAEQRRPKKGIGAGAITRTGVARDSGLSKRQKETALRVASIPKDEFEAAVESDEPPSESQRAMYAARLSMGSKRGRPEKGQHCPFSLEDAALALGASERLVKDARYILESGDFVAIAEAESGEALAAVRLLSWLPVPVVVVVLEPPVQPVMAPVEPMMLAIVMAIEAVVKVVVLARKRPGAAEDVPGAVPVVEVPVPCTVLVAEPVVPAPVFVLLAAVEPMMIPAVVPVVVVGRSAAGYEQAEAQGRQRGKNPSHSLMPSCSPAVWAVLANDARRPADIRRGTAEAPQ